jgi:hypothetical protein
VIKEEVSYGSKSGNGSWNGMVALVNSGNADIAISDFLVTKETSELVESTYALGFIR